VDTSAARINILTTNTTMISNVGNTPRNNQTWLSVTLTDTFAKKSDVDFDLSPFNLPRTLRGEMVVSIAASAKPSSGGKQIEMYFIVKLRKVSGSESDIVSVQSDTWQTGTTEVQNPNQFLIPLTVPSTPYKKGDVLRVTIEMWARNSIGGTAIGKFGYGHDPSNNFTPDTYTESNGITSRLMCFIPFKLDI
ncbi:hypothetical protein LCGC14_2425140, partial [marine sediment metagenome]